MKIFIAVPTFETVTPDTFKSIYGLHRCGNWCVFDFVRGYDCATARNDIARQAKAEQADYVFMVDSDIVLPSDALANLMEKPVDVCLGYYAHRTYGAWGGEVTVYRLGESDFTQQYTSADMAGMRANGINRVKVHGGGLGCALVRVDAFDRLEFPYFDWVNYGNGALLGEDTYFCDRCARAGIDIWVDTRVTCGHVMRRTEWAV